MQPLTPAEVEWARFLARRNMHGRTSWDNRDRLTPPDDPVDEMTEEELSAHDRQVNSELQRWAMRPEIPDVTPIVTELVDVLAEIAKAEKGIKEVLERGRK